MPRYAVPSTQRVSITHTNHSHCCLNYITQPPQANKSLSPPSEPLTWRRALLHSPPCWPAAAVCQAQSSPAVGAACTSPAAAAEGVLHTLPTAAAAAAGAAGTPAAASAALSAPTHHSLQRQCGGRTSQQSVWSVQINPKEAPNSASFTSLFGSNSSNTPHALVALTSTL